MTRRSIPLSASLALIAVLSVVALPAMAKEGAEARLDAPIPIDGPPGSTFQMRWTLVSVGADGTTSPIFGSPVYVRLTPADGGAAIELEAREAPEGSGHYVANVTVPDGGIDRLEVAMRGQSCDASGCQRADLTFPFASDGSVGVGSRPRPSDRSAPVRPRSHRWSRSSPPFRWRPVWARWSATDGRPSGRQPDPA